MMGFYSDNGIRWNTKCVSCGDTAKAIREQYDDYAIIDSSHSDKLGGWICFPCRESSDSMPQGTIVVFDPQAGEAKKFIVKDYEDTCLIDSCVEDVEHPNFDEFDYDECPIQFVYQRTDAWRGYYEPKAEGWKQLHSDCILSYSQDAEELKKFDVDVKRMLWELGHTFAVCFGRTSNVFSCGYDILIEERDEKDILKQLALYSGLMQLTIKYRDPERFRLTALTGKSEDFTEKDKLLAEAQKRLEKGEDFESIKEDILRKAQEL